jgi:2-dehydro-3-deoxyphosphogluconate aldolase / (4S)-4-hydroxy-2-oxoglutarate aldolase
MMPTGGVTLDAVEAYLAAGAAAVGISGAVFSNALITGDLTGLADRAAQLGPTRHPAEQRASQL